MFNIIWEFIINLLESFLFAVICNAKFTKRQYHYHTAEQTLFILCKSLLITLMNISKISTIISLTSVLLLNIIFLILFFVNPIFNSFFVSFIYCLILITSDALTLLIPIKFYNINLSQVLYLGNMRILFSLIYISIIALFVIIFLLFTPQVFVLGKLDKISYFIISTICVILEEIVLIILLKQSIYAENFFHLLLFIFGLTLFLFVYISIYIYRLGKEKEKNDRLIQSITINQMEARQNEEIINSTHSLRVFKHDIMNHMSILYKLVENGKNSDALKYIYQINNSIERTSYTISTGIIPIDCIMTAKLSKALDNNISIKHQIHFPANYNISDMDLCSLISNLLDNAIEANCKLDMTKRRLEIEIKPYNNMLLLFISNSSNGIYLYGGNGNLLTTKTSNKNEHGIGIKRINEIVKKYNGIIEFDPGTEIFSVSILFPLDN